MRQITRDAAVAFNQKRNFRLDNTQVIFDGESVKLYLHGNLIAQEDSSGLRVTLAGWPTPTTKERLNGLLQYLVCRSGFSQRKGVQYFDGAEVNEYEWVKV